ncbi:hypothetical protein [Planktothricoides sp. SR001]|uniref:hypothetical protein n=1 Tax=Planktothricoides sp. SR001 TaxID=1705388 RepID=UPI0012E18F47|nr:hypothetical protein [Planktothricoides sp. SR001]
MNHYNCGFVDYQGGQLPGFPRANPLEAVRHQPHLETHYSLGEAGFQGGNT